MTLSLDKLWTDSRAFLSDRFQELALIAGAFIFLPNLAFLYLISQPARIQEASASWIIGYLGVSIINVFATLAIVALVFRPSLSSGSAIRIAARIFPKAIVVWLLFSVAILAGLTLLILPAFYIYGRLWLVLPALVDEPERAITATFSRSWAMTEGNVLKAIALGAVLALAFILLTLPVAAAGALDVLLGLSDSDSPKIGLLAGLGSALVSALIGTAYAIFRGFAYRQLTGR